ncbi:MAG TPA: 1,6-anhydro-N-acetylmuramyl-L-alanine amidase AmpD [Methylibium sp.]|uniref:1,6-anhydro-N-acetylmuramyl-L-alanine amidase AmpD n=1 Tax=Methylibium sp. TaxID=2067992 RepID=UPI002DBE5597|nr:1,6-anhydro-N-acetylmuramyl-L-alanine amidase AmpD [Methylibium sp.]HEU4457925.1 1,6-anhydro-N-acetylmuramyl-L-alanine amidase AmpD [Methylibium sp.]
MRNARSRAISAVEPANAAGAWRGGWWSAARRIDSPNFGARPAGAAVELVVLHSISLPPGEYGGDAIERLFANTLDHAAHPYFEQLRGLRVSSHFVVRRDGELLQFVSTRERAWHAGASSWRGRGNCNDYSIGIELEGLEGGRFEAAQDERLIGLLAALRREHPRLRGIAGHEHVAPGRKADPGAGFDWLALQRRTRWPRAWFPEAVLDDRSAAPRAARRDDRGLTRAGGARSCRMP